MAKVEKDFAKYRKIKRFVFSIFHEFFIRKQVRELRE